MIFESQLATLMLKGVDRIALEPGDSQLHLLDTVSLVVEPIQPMIQLVGAGGSGNQSYLSSVTTTKTNGIADSNTLATLSPGLYTLNCYVAARANYTLIGIAMPDVTLNLVDGGTANPLIGIYAVTSSGAVWDTFKILLNRSMSIRLDKAANGVGQTLDVFAKVLVTRHL